MVPCPSWFNDIRLEDSLGNEDLYIQAERTQTTGHYHGALDGGAGPLTARAVAMFQKARG